tara:strand:+ start:9026 stop:9244 length:219 start_codon:yes stop_codon:yes gene_type:complete
MPKFGRCLGNQGASVKKMINVMEENKREQFDNDDIMSKIYEELEREKEQKFVNLMIEIIVSLTLSELYEEGD